MGLTVIPGTTVKFVRQKQIGYMLPEVASVEYCTQFLSEAGGHYVHKHDGPGGGGP
jgi:hypothetical protein